MLVGEGVHAGRPQGEDETPGGRIAASSPSNSTPERHPGGNIRGGDAVPASAEARRRRGVDGNVSDGNAGNAMLIVFHQHNAERSPSTRARLWAGAGVRRVCQQVLPHRFGESRAFFTWEQIFYRCELVYDHRLLDSAAAVLFHPGDIKPSYCLPARRSPGQPWIFLSFESPSTVASKVNLARLGKVFN
ncbi:hypothetical protein O3P69_014200 [Scylla paramamosain]|uniref:Fucosyltransferase N-terminal domain-containing protein n=1 Tax=Scylla paramamosain TaxID=85552 RepID=A0AAW0SAJ7_SCYPA